jgi:hypothetical protein
VSVPPNGFAPSFWTTVPLCRAASFKLIYPKSTDTHMRNRTDGASLPVPDAHCSRRAGDLGGYELVCQTGSIAESNCWIGDHQYRRIRGCSRQAGFTASVSMRKRDDAQRRQSEPTE